MSGTGTFLVASGNTIVPAFLPDSLLRFYGATNGSFPTKGPPAELAKNGGELLYYDVTNDRYTNTGGLTSSSLKVVNQNSLQVNNLSAITFVSAATYLNLPSSTIVWASANYATLAGSATSALNAQQAPNGFVVTGTVSATTVSATTVTADSGIIKNTLDIASGIYSVPIDSRLYVQGKSYFQNQLTVNSNLYVTGTASAITVSATNISGTTITATTLSATTISTPKYPTYIYTATGISVGTNKLMFDMFNGAGSGKTLKVTRIVAYVRNTTTITGINQVLECYRTSSVGTGGTTVTEAKMVTSDPALNANITARNTPTGGASYYNSSGVLAAANIYTEEGQNLQERVYLYMYDSFAGLEECLTVREGEGLRINTGAVGAAGVIGIYVYFITV